MNILYVYAHPHTASFNSMLKTRGMEVLQHLPCHVDQSDLYAQGFNPVASWEDFPTENGAHTFAADVSREIEKIKRADHLIFQFPLWWFTMPAMLKGWFDRVFVQGFAYDTGKVFQKGLLKGKTASLVVSTLSPASAYHVDGAHHATLQTFLHPIDHALHFMGINTLTPFITYAAFQLDEKQQEKIATAYGTYLTKLVMGQI